MVRIEARETDGNSMIKSLIDIVRVDFLNATGTFEAF